MLELRWLVQRVKQELVQIAQPALIVHPREDDRASLRNVYFLQEKLGGPTQTVVLDDSYHIVTLDRQRELVVQRTRDFVSQDEWKSVAADQHDSLHRVLNSAG
jgi:carboxylesterase